MVHRVAGVVECGGKLIAGLQRACALGLGTWQGLYLWEHRHGAMRREIIVTLAGES